MEKVQRTIGDWVVEPDGTIIYDDYYIITSDRLLERNLDGLLSWPIHLQEKSWFVKEDFKQAWMWGIYYSQGEPSQPIKDEIAHSLTLKRF